MHLRFNPVANSIYHLNPANIALIHYNQTPGPDGLISTFIYITGIDQPIRLPLFPKALAELIQAFEVACQK